MTSRLEIPALVAPQLGVLALVAQHWHPFPLSLTGGGVMILAWSEWWVCQLPGCIKDLFLCPAPQYLLYKEEDVRDVYRRIYLTFVLHL